MADVLLTMQGVAKHYRAGSRRFSALRGIDLAISQGELVVVLGRSGAGKTTLLSLAGGLDVPDEGRVVFEGEEISGLDQVALARSLVKSPRLLLADEPTGQLDTHTATQVIDLVREAARAGTTVLAATHDESLADVADRVLHMDDGALVAR